MPLDLFTETSYSSYNYVLTLFDNDTSVLDSAYYQQLTLNTTNPHPKCEVTGELSLEDVSFSLILNEGPKLSFIYFLNYGYTCDASEMTAVFQSKESSDGVRVMNEQTVSADAG
jgi:hypothetical protein